MSMSAEVQLLQRVSPWIYITKWVCHAARSPELALHLPALSLEHLTLKLSQQPLNRRGRCISCLNHMYYCIV